MRNKNVSSSERDRERGRERGGGRLRGERKLRALCWRPRASWGFCVHQRLLNLGVGSGRKVLWALAVMSGRLGLPRASPGCELGLGQFCLDLERWGPWVTPGLHCCYHPHHHYPLDDYRWGHLPARMPSSNPDSLNFFPAECRSVAALSLSEWRSTLGLLVISLNQSITGKK